MNIVEEQEPKTEIIKRKVVDNSPFTIVSLEDEGHFGVMGKWRITESFDSVEEAEKDLNVINWNRVIQICSIMMQADKDGVFNDNNILNND